MKQKMEQCPVCKGKGVLKNSFLHAGKVCKACDGVGEVSRSNKSILKRFAEYTVLI